jgi:ubiquinone/menaquinone biosynthesis C-methylase UbiE
MLLLLPFEGGSFDYVSISFGLHDKEECIRKAVIEEINRVVKPGGSIILIDFAIPLPGNLWAWLARIIEFMAGGSHYQGFKNFKANGGLKSIMSNHNLARQRTGLFKSGLVEVVQAGLLAEKGNYNRQTGLGG